MSAISEELVAAAKAVDDASIADDLRASAFAAAFWGSRQLGKPRATSTAARVSTNAKKSVDVDSPPPARLGGDVAERTTTISVTLGIDEEDVQRVFDLDADEIGLLVAQRLLPPAFTAAAADVTYLVVGARQALGEEWTEAQDIKDVLEERGHIDRSRNLSRIWSDLDGRGLSIKGPKTARRFKMNGTGFQTAGEIAKRLAAAGSA